MTDVPWEDIFKLFLLLLVSSVTEFRLELMYYIPHRIHQVKLHSSPWFSAAWAAAIVYRNHFFCLCQKNKSSESKVKFRQAIEQKSLSLLRNLALGTFGKLLIVFSTKVNVLYFLFSMAQVCCLLHLINRNCLVKTFLRTLILMIQVALYLFCF